MDSIIKTLFTRRVKTFNNRTAGEKVGFIYRYSSWFLTSLFYLLGDMWGSAIHKNGIIICLFIFTCIMDKLYIKSAVNPKKRRIAILIEMLFITYLLIPSGGIESPFIWYAINPVLAAASLLAPYYCWLNTFLYVTCAFLISFTLFNEEGISLSKITYDNLYIILAFILVVLAVQLLSKLAIEQKRQSSELMKAYEKLERTNHRLEKVNEKARDLVKHILSLYKVVEAFNIQSNPKKLPGTIAEYAVKLSGASISFFWADPLEEYESSINIKDSEIAYVPDDIFEDVRQQWEDIKKNAGVMKIRAGGYDFLAVTVKSSSRYYGVIGIEYGSLDYSTLSESVYTRLLMFLSELSTAVLERIKLEEVSDHVMIIEEQNRIANEIHDSVSQRMFGIVCAMHSLSHKWDDMEADELQDRLESVETSARLAMQELRSSIYSLSSRKNGDRVLSSSIREYVDGFSKLNGIKVDMDISGDEDAVPPSVKKALYRIICEAAGNAARHGICKNIKLELDFQPFITCLAISDDGKGFSMGILNLKNSGGLGLYNMKMLVQSLYGDFKINSKINKGTEINISIPNNHIYEEIQGGIVQ